MSTTYNVTQGDTFESISRKVYGVETNANIIQSANPGASLPLESGITLVVPTIESEPKNASAVIDTDNISEVTVTIEGKRFRFWSSLQLTRSMDNIDTAEFTAPFDPSDVAFREAFRPFTYKPVSISVGGDTVFTGTMVGSLPELESGVRTISVSCYSLPGVLYDCTLPASAYNVLESNGQTLQEVTKSVVSPFGLSTVFEADTGAVFERVAMETNERVIDYLIRLAKQRNLIINSSVKGELVFTQAKVSQPVANLSEGSSPLMSVIPFMDPRGYYSHVTGLEPVNIGTAGSQYTVKNPRLEGVVRPISFNTPDTQDADVQSAVEAKAARMFGSVANYSVTVATWRDSQGNLWEPNTQVNLAADGAMVYNSYKFTIRSVEFVRDANSEVAVLDLVIPESFTGKIPSALPWD